MSPSRSCAVSSAALAVTARAVSYTHLDVYKRQDPERAEHLSNTFSALLEMGVIPVVNENDSVSSAEIETDVYKRQPITPARWTFGAWNIWCGPWRISRAWGMR